MVKIGIRNIRLLKFLSKIPVLHHFFILKPNENFASVNDETILSKFYKDIYVSSKTSKQTAKGRFKDLEPYLLKYLKKDANIIHDLAVSSGISSVDMLNYLKNNNISFTLNISDKYGKAYAKKGFTNCFFDSDGKLMFAYISCFFAADKNRFFPLTTLLFKLLKNTKAPQKPDYTIQLFDPKVIKLQSQNKLNIIDYDIFTTEILDKYSFVRCMNILNKVYFSEEQITVALANISKSIKNEGVLLVGRTREGNVNRASFFKKSADKFVWLEDVNDGSEIKELVLRVSF